MSDLLIDDEILLLREGLSRLRETLRQKLVYVADQVERSEIEALVYEAHQYAYRLTCTSLGLKKSKIEEMGRPDYLAAAYDLLRDRPSVTEQEKVEVVNEVVRFLRANGEPPEENMTWPW